ncbi:MULTISPECIES: hypothetical protein [Mycolicibacterium]|nr:MULTISPECIES: hypothetical protein [Mycolicibacterium]MDN4519682.1 hypothetical protein [Mycolicibacterium austroafricanum]
MTAVRCAAQPSSSRTPCPLPALTAAAVINLKAAGKSSRDRSNDVANQSLFYKDLLKMRGTGRAGHLRNT